MLQWMGGSRRKVSTSRKSIQKRQKQYFEQRRKQLQQTTGLESFVKGVNIFEQNYKERRSLDVLSWQNLSTITKEGMPTSNIESPSEFSGREKPKVNASTVKCHIEMDPPIIQANPVSLPHPLEFKEASTMSAYQPETASPKKVLSSSSTNYSRTFSGTESKLDPCKLENQQSFSLFDLLADDGSKGNSDGNPACEAHVAFSVEGLGKVGTETPPQSPRYPDSYRYVSYGCPSLLKAARNISSSKNLDYVPNDIEIEVDALMQNIGMPLRDDHLDFPIEIEDSYCKLNNSLSAIEDSMHPRDHGRMNSSVSGRTTFGETEKINVDIWDARCRSWDANFLDERESDISYRRWPYPLDDNYADFLKFGNNRMADYGFDDSHLPKKRNSMKATGRIDILESTSRKQRTSEDDFNFIISERNRQPSLGTSFGLGDATIGPNWSCFKTEDARDNQSFLSEESCSSAAVTDEETDISRHSPRHRNASCFPEIHCSAENPAARGRQFKYRDDIQQRNNPFGSGKSTWVPTLSGSRSGCNLGSPFQDRMGSHRNWFEEGFRLAETNMGFSSHADTKHPSSGSKPWTEDTSGAFTHEPQIDSKFSFDAYKHGGSVKYSPSDRFLSEKFDFCQQVSWTHARESPAFSEVEFGATKLDLSPDSPDFVLEVRPPYSSDDAAPLGEKLNSDSSAQESVISKEKKNRSKSQQAKCEKLETQNVPVERNMMTAESEEKGPDCKDEKERPLETSSSVKIPDKSESSVDEKEYDPDAAVPNPCENSNKAICLTHPNTEKGNIGPEERKMGRHSSCLDLSSPVMMLESYVLQLLSVQKTPKESSVRRP